jgi:hypothetical protein
MKLLRIFPQRTALAVLAGALLALALLPGCKKAAKPAPPAAPKPAAHLNTNAVPGANLPTEFVSVFDDSLPPGNKGRDPFNPDSTSRNPAAAEPKSTAPTAPVAPQLKLYGITGSRGHWLAHINNQFLMLTDPATSVRVPGGTVKVKIVEIGEDYADITIDDSATKTRLTMGQKK